MKTAWRETNFADIEYGEMLVTGKRLTYGNKSLDKL
jgi:hypothetical protein